MKYPLSDNLKREIAEVRRRAAANAIARVATACGFIAGVVCYGIFAAYVAAGLFE